MFCTSKIQLINKKEPTLTFQEWVEEKRAFRKRTIDNYLINIGDELEIIGQSVYCYKDGLFYVIKKKNDVFFLDSNDVSFSDEQLIFNEMFG